MNIELEILELRKRVEKLEQMLKVPSKIEDSKPKDRDKTRYMFENKVLAKNRLVLSVVSKYVKDFNPTYEELIKVFDKSLQGSRGVVELEGNAKRVSDAKKRYFMDKPIYLKDGNIVVVCTQWGAFNIYKFIVQASSLGYKVEEVKQETF